MTPATRSQLCSAGSAYSGRHTGALSLAVMSAVSSGAQPSNSRAMRAVAAALSLKSMPANQSSAPSQAVSLQVVGSDPDAGQTLSWVATGLPAGLSINPSTGLISGTIGANAATGSPYTVTVTATDNGVPVLSASQTFTWTVTTGGGGGGNTYVSDLTPTSSTNGWGPVEKDKSNGETGAGDGGPITLNGTVFAKGLGTHALSDVRYTVPTEAGSSGSPVFDSDWNSMAMSFAPSTCT